MTRWLLVPVIVLSGMAAAQVWLSHERYELARQHQLVVRQLSEQRAEIKRLQLEMASLTRPERLREAAVRRLDMHPPTPAQVVHL